MCTRGIIGDIVGGRRHLCSGRVHGSLVDIVPKRAEIHVISTVIVEKIAINSIVALGGRRRDTRASAVCPRPGLHCGGCGQPDGRVLRAKRRDAVVDMIKTIH